MEINTTDTLTRLLRVTFPVISESLPNPTSTLFQLFSLAQRRHPLRPARSAPRSSALGRAAGDWSLLALAGLGSLCPVPAWPDQPTNHHQQPIKDTDKMGRRPARCYRYCKNKPFPKSREWTRRLAGAQRQAQVAGRNGA